VLSCFEGTRATFLKRVSDVVESSAHDVTHLGESATVLISAQVLGLLERARAERALAKPHMPTGCVASALPSASVRFAVAGVFQQVRP
jgi:hypothetical protein